MSINGGPSHAMPPRQSFPPGASWLGLVVIVAAVVLASGVAVLPSFKTQNIAVNTQATPVPGASFDTGNLVDPNGSPLPNQSGVPGVNPSGGSVTQGGGNPAGFQCAPGRNGGNTDTGVAGDSIKLASTVVQSGIGEVFLGDVRYGMIAVIHQTNRAGGVCGRRLDLEKNILDDGWDGPTGEQDIRGFIAGGAFALPVVPSSQGLDLASGAGVIDRAGIPVVGTDGMLISQYADPWIWPVSTSTISTAHIAVKSAYDAGARKFGIVWDQSYKFGTEGEAAFKGAISRLPGAQLLADVGVDAGAHDYSTPGGDFNHQCHVNNGQTDCDMVFVLLEPNTAETWFSTSGMVLGKQLTEGPQPLFVDTFGQNCGSACNNMVVWTSYYPPRAPFSSNSAVARYVSSIRSESQSADPDNQFLEGGYEGMLLFVKALQQVGPNLTRTNLRATLDNLTFDSGLTQPLTWHAGNHFANTAMLEFKIQYSQGFNGFQYQQSDWVSDPWPQLDHNKS